MRKLLSSAVATAAIAASGFVAFSAPANAATSGAATENISASTSIATVAPAFACPVSFSSAHVSTNVDFLLVHAAPGNNPNNVYGQIPGGNQVCLQDDKRVKADNLYWRYGYGYNGSARVPRSGSGWMAEKYLR